MTHLPTWLLPVSCLTGLIAPNLDYWEIQGLRLSHQDPAAIRSACCLLLASWLTYAKPTNIQKNRPVWLALALILPASWLIASPNLRFGFCLGSVLVVFVAGANHQIPRQSRANSVLLILGFPHEDWLGPIVSHPLQAITSELARSAVAWTDVDIQIEYPEKMAPRLVLEDLHIYVTEQCAGIQIMLAVGSVATTLALLVLYRNRTRFGFVVGMLIWAFSVNLIRVILTAQSSVTWARDPLDFEVAHEWLGFASFVLIYAVMFYSAHRLRSPTMLNTPNATTNKP